MTGKTSVWSCQHLFMGTESKMRNLSFVVNSSIVAFEPTRKDTIARFVIPSEDLNHNL